MGLFKKKKKKKQDDGELEVTVHSKQWPLTTRSFWVSNRDVRVRSRKNSNRIDVRWSSHLNRILGARRQPGQVVGGGGRRQSHAVPSESERKEVAEGKNLWNLNGEKLSRPRCWPVAPTKTLAPSYGFQISSFFLNLPPNAIMINSSINRSTENKKVALHFSVAKPFSPICVRLDVSFAYFSLVLRILPQVFPQQTNQFRKALYPTLSGYITLEHTSEITHACTHIQLYTWWRRRRWWCDDKEEGTKRTWFRIEKHSSNNSKTQMHLYVSGYVVEAAMVNGEVHGNESRRQNECR